VEGVCDEACRKPAKKTARRKTRTRFSESFVTISPGWNARSFEEWSIAEPGQAGAQVVSNHAWSTAYVAEYPKLMLSV
jgi:hypothetical protein